MLIELVYKSNVQNAYDYNVAYLKKYGDKYKVQVLKCVRKKGVSSAYYSSKGSVNDEKLDCNIRRAKNRIKELVLCNDWEYFITLTLDPEKYDRYNLDKFTKDLSQYIRNLRRKLDVDIKYILIPEQHRNGAWHMHGFIMGLPLTELRKFTVDEKLPLYILDKIRFGQDVFEWLGYSDKFGFCDLEPIRDKDRASSYVTKYVTKNLENSVKEVNAKMYYCSRGLNKSREIKKGCTTQLYNPTYVKTDDNGEILYSEMWLPTTTTEKEARRYVYNNFNIEDSFLSMSDDDENPFLLNE